MVSDSTPANAALGLLHTIPHSAHEAMRNDRAYRDAIKSKRGSDRVDVRPRARDPAIDARAPARGWGSHGHIRRADRNSAVERLRRRLRARGAPRAARPRGKCGSSSALGRLVEKLALGTRRYMRGYLIKGSSFT